MLALGIIDSGLKQFEAMYAGTIWQYGQKEIDSLRKQIANGLDIKETLGDNSSGLFGYRRQMRLALINVLGRVKNFGRGEVRDELLRQKP